LAEYERCFADADARHAMLEDYPRGASIDLEHDRADLHRKVEVPTLVVWGANVRGRAPTGEPARRLVQSEPSTCAAPPSTTGHFLVEERPTETLDLLQGFLAGPLHRNALQGRRPRGRAACGGMSSDGSSGSALGATVCIDHPAGPVHRHRAGDERHPGAVGHRSRSAVGSSSRTGAMVKPDGLVVGYGTNTRTPSASAVS
jgi:hypothetical protein